MSVYISSSNNNNTPIKKRPHNNNEEEFRDQSLSKKRKQEINPKEWITQEDLENDFLPSLKKIPQDQTIKKIKEIFAQKKDRFHINITLTEPKTFVKISLKTTPYYKSDALNSSILDEGVRKNLYFHNIKVIEQNKVTILKVTLSSNCCFAELAWVAKGIKFSGNDVLKFYNVIEKLFHIQNTYLYDDARIEFTRSDTLYKVPLRFTYILGKDEGYSSWYEQNGFKISEFKDAFTIWGTPILQDETTFKTAKNFVRNTTLTDFTHFLKGRPKELKILKRIIKKYNIIDKQATIHTLVKILCEKSKSSDKKEKEKALYDLYLFIEDCMAPWVSEHGTQKQKKFLEALQTIENLCLFVKNSSQTTSY